MDIPTLKKFAPLTPIQVTKHIANMQTKSCEFNPIPTHVLKQILPVLISIERGRYPNQSGRPPNQGRYPNRDGRPPGRGGYSGGGPSDGGGPLMEMEDPLDPLVDKDHHVLNYLLDQ